MLGPEDIPLIILEADPLSPDPPIIAESKLVFGVAMVACALKYLMGSFYGVNNVDL